jgi:polygalacturonase
MLVTEPSFPGNTFSIKDFGAIGDGQTLNITSFSKTIDTCVKAGSEKVSVFLREFG